MSGKKTVVSIFTFAAMVMLSAPAFASTANDAGLAQRVHESLGSYYGSGVSVQTRGNSVYLSGYVGTESDKKEAAALAEKVPGVKMVHQNLESLSGSES